MDGLKLAEFCTQLPAFENQESIEKGFKNSSRGFNGRYAPNIQTEVLIKPPVDNYQDDPFDYDHHDDSKTMVTAFKFSKNIQRLINTK